MGYYADWFNDWNDWSDFKMSEELKPANQNPDFGKVCQHGSLKRQCYTCELEEEIDRLKAENEKTKEVLREIRFVTTDPAVIELTERALKEGGDKNAVNTDYFHFIVVVVSLD